MNIVQWAYGALGRVLTAPGGLGGQCVDLTNVYVMARGAVPVRRNAADWALPGALPGWSWTPNGPTNAPPIGAVVVWTRDITRVGIGPDGHVAVALAADATRLLTLDQNWPTGSPVSLVWHSYAGVLGWWVHP